MHFCSAAPRQVPTLPSTLCDSCKASLSSPSTTATLCIHIHIHIHIAAIAMAIATLSLAPATPCAPSLRLKTSPSTTPTSRAALLGTNGLMKATSLRLQTALGAPKQAPQRRSLSCQASSADKNETVAAGEQKVSEVKESLSEKQGPPFLTIIAGIIVAALVVWGLWSIVSAILGIFFH